MSISNYRVSVNIISTVQVCVVGIVVEGSERRTLVRCRRVGLSLEGTVY